MVFSDIKPRTKLELVSLQQLLTTTKTIEEARVTFPENLLKFVEEESKTSKKNFESIAKDIKIYLSNMKYIKVYVAFEPKMQLLERMFRAFKIEQTDRYLDVVCDKSLVGGVKVVFDGKQYDETVDKIIYEKCL